MHEKVGMEQLDRGGDIDQQRRVRWSPNASGPEEH